MPEEQYFDSLPVGDNLVKDFRDITDSRFKGWSAIIPLIIIKDRLIPNEGAYLINNKSVYTFIRKTRTQFGPYDKLFDINLMPPLVIKNCLPFKLYIKFKDSSEVTQTESFFKNEEKHLFCFNMSQTVKVDVFIPGFGVVKEFSLFDLENFKKLEDQIELCDTEGRMTRVHTLISR